MTARHFTLSSISFAVSLAVVPAASGHADAELMRLPEASPPGTFAPRDGDVVDLTLGPVRKRVGDTWVRMLAYNGSIPGPTLRLPQGQAVAIAMEIGIHNAALAIFIALNVLRNPAAAVVPGIYSLIMYVTASAFAVWLLRRNAALRPA